MNATIGFVTCSFAQRPAITSSVPPISPIRMMPSVAGSLLNSPTTSVKLIPFTGSPPMPTHVVWPMPRDEHCQTAS